MRVASRTGSTGNWSSGTGGLRGVIGGGSKPMNTTTSARRIQGLAKIINSTESPKQVVICYISRIKMTCSHGRRPGYWRPTASPPGCIPGWSPPRP